MRSGTRSQIVTTVEGQRTTGTPSADGQRDIPGALTIPAGSKSADLLLLVCVSFTIIGQP